MLYSFKQRMALMNSLCRICGQEDTNCIPVFSESGKKQEIEKKIRLCLPLIIEEADTLPKQICLTCLHKLDAAWELNQLCKDGQVLIEEKLHSLSEMKSREEVMFKHPTLSDEKVRSLSENRPITIGDSAIITLVPAKESPPIEVPPPVSSEPVMGMMPTYQVSAPVTTVAPTPPDPDSSNVYPQGLIQVLPSSKPVLYQQQHNNTVQQSHPVPGPQSRIPQAKCSIPQPKTEVITSKPTPPQRTKHNTSKRAPTSMRNGNSKSAPAPKRALLLCKYCKKSFPDEIIDHHVSLHLRQSFFTCIDCNKNFRSEMAMSRHRCDTSDASNCDVTNNKSINLDPDDDLICL